MGFVAIILLYLQQHSFWYVSQKKKKVQPNKLKENSSEAAGVLTDNREDAG